MKANILHIVMLMLFLSVMTSCEKHSPAPGPAGSIRFGAPSLQLQTRSGMMDGITSGEFGVIGYCLSYAPGSFNIDYGSGTSRWAVKKFNCPPTVFDQQKVSVDGSLCTYEYGNGSGVRYWYKTGYDLDGQPDNGVGDNADDYRYTFFAYYPFSSSFWNVDYQQVEHNNESRDVNGPIITFTMPQTGDDLSSELNSSLTPDAMLAMESNVTKGSGSVNFEFSHILTALGFEINNFSDYPLTVQSLRIQGSFFKKVVVDFSQRDENMVFSFPKEYYTGYYPLFNGNLDLSTDASSPVQTAGPDQLGGHIMLISGEGSYFGNDIELRIDYTFNNEKKQDIPVIRPGTFTPVPGVKYTAQLNFVGDAFVLQFVVDNEEMWEDGIPGEDDNVIFE